MWPSGRIERSPSRNQLHVYTIYGVWHSKGLIVVRDDWMGSATPFHRVDNELVVLPFHSCRQLQFNKVVASVTMQLKAARM